MNLGEGWLPGGDYISLMIRLLLLLPVLAMGAWSPTNGPTGQGIQGIAGDGTDLYVVHNHGANRSRDRGATWEEYGWGLDGGGLRMSLAARKGAVFVGCQQGIYARLSEGVPFIRSNTGLADSAVRTLEFVGDTLYAGTDHGGVYRTADWGAYWERVTPAGMAGMVFGIVVSGKTILASTYRGFYRSLDNGANWTRSDPGPGDSLGRGLSRNDRYFFMRTESRLFRSADSGAHWTRLEPFGESVSAGYWSFDAVGTRLFAQAIDGLRISADDGTTWTRDSSFFNLRNTSTVTEIIGLDGYLFAGCFHGVYRSQDQGATWAGANTGIGIGPINAFAGLGAGRMLAASPYGIYATTDSGAHWTLEKDPSPTAGPARALAVMGVSVLAFVNYGGVFCTADLGKHWEKRADFPGTEAHSLTAIGRRLFLETNAGQIFVSLDSGRTFGLTMGGSDPERIGMVALGPDGIYAPTSYGVARYDTVSGWKLVPAPLAASELLAVGASGPALLAGTYGEGVFRSLDGGRTWTHPLDSTGIHRISGFLEHADVAFVASDSGFHVSRDNGATWTPANAGLPVSHQVQSMRIQDGYLYAGIYLGGIWKRPLADFGPTGILPRPPGSRGRALTRGPAASRGRIGFSPAGPGETAGLRDALGKLLPDRDHSLPPAL